MSHADDGPLANYNSLLDPHLSGYFSNTRIRKHLRKSGLVTKRGAVVTENQFRVNMARKEHRLQVRELLATAIVHRTLDTERQRQATIKRKLEEIAKAELVKRVKAERNRSGDFSVLPYLSPRRTAGAYSSAPLLPRRHILSGAVKASVDNRPHTSGHYDDGSSPLTSDLTPRPSTADVLDGLTARRDNVTAAGPEGAVSQVPLLGSSEQPSESVSAMLPTDADGYPVLRQDGFANDDWLHIHAPSTGLHPRSGRSSRSLEFDAGLDVPQRGDSSLSSETRREGRTISPRHVRQNNPYEGISPDPIDTRNLWALDRTAVEKYNEVLEQEDLGRQRSPYKENLLLSALGPETPHPPAGPRHKGTALRRKLVLPRHKGGPNVPENQASHKAAGTPGVLMLHRLGPAFKEQEQVQSFCEVTLRFFGGHLHLERRKGAPVDASHDVVVEQQHCGGSTLVVFRGLLYPKKNFTITSRRHRGYPFSLTFFVDGVQDARLSTCCEYKHQSGYRLGGKKGHFGVVAVSGSAPCYRCQVERGLNISTAPPRPQFRYGGKSGDTRRDAAHTEPGAAQSHEDKCGSSPAAAEAQPHKPSAGSAATADVAANYGDDFDTDESGTDNQPDPAKNEVGSASKSMEASPLAALRAGDKRKDAAEGTSVLQSTSDVAPGNERLGQLPVTSDAAEQAAASLGEASTDASKDEGKDVTLPATTANYEVAAFYEDDFEKDDVDDCGRNKLAHLSTETPYGRESFADTGELPADAADNDYDWAATARGCRAASADSSSSSSSSSSKSSVLRHSSAGSNEPLTSSSRKVFPQYNSSKHRGFRHNEITSEKIVDGRDYSSKVPKVPRGTRKSSISSKSSNDSDVRHGAPTFITQQQESQSEHAHNVERSSVSGHADCESHRTDGAIEAHEKSNRREEAVEFPSNKAAAQVELEEALRQHAVASQAAEFSLHVQSSSPTIKIVDDDSWNVRQFNECDQQQHSAVETACAAVVASDVKIDSHATVAAAAADSSLTECSATVLGISPYAEHPEPSVSYTDISASGDDDGKQSDSAGVHRNGFERNSQEDILMDNWSAQANTIAKDQHNPPSRELLHEVANPYPDNDYATGNNVTGDETANKRDEDVTAKNAIAHEDLKASDVAREAQGEDLDILHYASAPRTGTSPPGDTREEVETIGAGYRDSNISCATTESGSHTNEAYEGCDSTVSGSKESQNAGVTAPIKQQDAESKLKSLDKHYLELVAMNVAANLPVSGTETGGTIKEQSETSDGKISSFTSLEYDGHENGTCFQHHTKKDWDDIALEDNAVVKESDKKESATAIPELVDESNEIEKDSILPVKYVPNDALSEAVYDTHLQPNFDTSENVHDDGMKTEQDAIVNSRTNDAVQGQTSCFEADPKSINATDSNGHVTPPLGKAGQTPAAMDALEASGERAQIQDAIVTIHIQRRSSDTGDYCRPGPNSLEHEPLGTRGAHVLLQEEGGSTAADSVSMLAVPVQLFPDARASFPGGSAVVVSQLTGAAQQMDLTGELTEDRAIPSRLPAPNITVAMDESLATSLASVELLGLRTPAEALPESQPLEGKNYSAAAVAVAVNDEDADPKQPRVLTRSPLDEMLPSVTGHHELLDGHESALDTWKETAGAGKQLGKATQRVVALEDENLDMTTLEEQLDDKAALNAAQQNHSMELAAPRGLAANESLTVQNDTSPLSKKESTAASTELGSSSSSSSSSLDNAVGTAASSSDLVAPHQNTATAETDVVARNLRRGAMTLQASLEARDSPVSDEDHYSSERFSEAKEQPQPVRVERLIQAGEALLSHGKVPEEEQASGDKPSTHHVSAAPSAGANDESAKESWPAAVGNLSERVSATHSTTRAESSYSGVDSIKSNASKYVSSAEHTSEKESDRSESRVAAVQAGAQSTSAHDQHDTAASSSASTATIATNSIETASIWRHTSASDCSIPLDLTMPDDDLSTKPDRIAETHDSPLAHPNPGASHNRSIVNDGYASASVAESSQRSPANRSSSKDTGLDKIADVDACLYRANTEEQSAVGTMIFYGKPDLRADVSDQSMVYIPNTGGAPAATKTSAERQCDMEPAMMSEDNSKRMGIDAAAAGDGAQQAYAQATSGAKGNEEMPVMLLATEAGPAELNPHPATHEARNEANSVRGGYRHKPETAAAFGSSLNADDGTAALHTEYEEQARAAIIDISQ